MPRAPQHRGTKQSTPSGPSNPPPHAAAFAAAGVKLICDTYGLADLYPGKRRKVLYLQLLHWRKKTNSMATYQTVLAREAGCSPRLVKRTEATGRILAIYTAARWWQSADRQPAPYSQARRTHTPPDRWRRRLRMDPLLRRLLTDRSLSGRQRRSLTNRLRQQIIARACEALAVNPGPLARILTQVTGPIPPLSATELPRTTWAAALGYKPTPSNTGDASVPGYPSGTKAVPSGRGIAEASLPRGREARAFKPPAPTGPKGTATPPPARAVGPSDGHTTAALAFGEAPAAKTPVAGGPGKDQATSTPPLHPDLTADLSQTTRRRYAALARFNAPDRADLRRAIRFAAERPHRVQTADDLPTWLRAAVATACDCDEDTAAWLLEWYCRQLALRHRHTPRGPRPQPKTVITDLQGSAWVLDWQHPTRTEG